MALTFEQLQKEVGEWSRYNFPRNTNYHPLMGIVEEVGELHHARLKYEQNIRGMSHEEYIAAQADALGDILIYMADYCARNDVDLQDAIEKTWHTVKLRNWRQFPKNGISE